ncbi:alternative ribosome rescue aminoacyl-tRNA hydrolase ArfB [Dyadobacter tibetensis]|uniref:alternative ribosome rescue aminoacyl-tRNA hydrolase ArfB n=1 Tax=Dyadobacter tibetensis TaxID=1211851 RepID=UPI00046E9893|nr:alternative ribosome rescue aminoacyl-tRNA hydrolase ArfB [Dyadobacter tibetensis]
MVSIESPDPVLLLQEVVFQTARSGGSGGQHVNKLETKVELRFDVQGSSLLTNEQRDIIIDKLKNRLTQEGVLILFDQSSRTQLANKKGVIEKFKNLLERAFQAEKPRKSTKPTFASKLKRLKGKKKRSATKLMRGKPDIEL